LTEQRHSRSGLHRIYYYLELAYGSPDAANPEVTTRVLTILLADEY
ncbi:DUF3768 domain-containing protein, partial [Sphingobium sp. DC-2]